MKTNQTLTTWVVASPLLLLAVAGAAVTAKLPTATGVSKTDCDFCNELR